MEQCFLLTAHLMAIFLIVEIKKMASQARDKEIIKTREDLRGAGNTYAI